MITDYLDAALLSMVEHTPPHAIIMDPRKLKELLREEQAHHRLSEGHAGSGWTFDGLPIWRSWHITGLSAVSKSALQALQVLHTVSLEMADADGPVREYREPLLF